jgi:autotransporter translocation and assembly factor TamB
MTDSGDTSTPSPPEPQPAAPKKKRRWPRVLAAVALLLIAVAVAPMLSPVQDFARAKIVDAANGALSGRLSIERISGTVWTGVRIEGVRLYDARQNLILSAPSATATYDLLALPSTARLNGLVLDQPLVIARIYPDNVPNFTLIAPPSPPSDQPTRLPLGLDLEKIQLRGGSLVFFDDRALPPDADPALVKRLDAARDALAGEAKGLTGDARGATIAALTAPRALSQPAPPRLLAIHEVTVDVDAQGDEAEQTVSGSLELGATATADSWSEPVLIKVEQLRAAGPLTPGTFTTSLGALLLTTPGSEAESGLRDVTASAELIDAKATPDALPISALSIALPALRLDRSLITALAAGLPVKSGAVIKLDLGLKAGQLTLTTLTTLTEAPGSIALDATAKDLIPALLNPDAPADPAPTYTLKATITRISPNDVWPLPFPVSAEGELNLEGEGIEPMAARIKLDASLRDTTIDIATIESLTLAAGLDAGAATLTTLALRTPWADLDASGDARLNGPFHLDAHVLTTERHQAQHTLPDGRTVRQRDIDVTARVEGELDALAAQPLDKVPQATLTTTASIGQLEAPGLLIDSLRTTKTTNSPAAQPVTASVALQPDGTRRVRWDLGVAADRLQAPGLNAAGLDAITQGQTTLPADLSDVQAILDALRIELVAHASSLRAGAQSVGASSLTASLEPTAEGGIRYTIRADVAAIKAPGASVRRVRTLNADGAPDTISGTFTLAPDALKQPGPQSITRASASGPVRVEGVRAGPLSIDDITLTPQLSAAPLLNPAGTLAVRLRGLSMGLAGPPDTLPEVADNTAAAVKRQIQRLGTTRAQEVRDAIAQAASQLARAWSGAQVKATPKPTRQLRIPQADALLTFAAADKSFALTLDADYVRPGEQGAGAPIRLDGAGSLELAAQRVGIKRLALQLPGSLWQLGPTTIQLLRDGASISTLELRADPIALDAQPKLADLPPALGRLGVVRVDGALRLRGRSDITAELNGWDLALLRGVVDRLWDTPIPAVRGKIHNVVASLKGTARSPDIGLLVAADGLFFEKQGPFAVALDGELDARGVRVRHTGVLGWGYPLLSLTADLPIQIGLDRPPVLRWEDKASLRLALANIKLDDLQKPLDAVAKVNARGTVSGHIDLSGSLASPRVDARFSAQGLAASPTMSGQPLKLKDLDLCAALCYRPPGSPVGDQVCSAGCGDTPTQGAPDGLTASARVIWEQQPFATLEASAALPIAQWVRAFFERGEIPVPDRDILRRQFNLFLDVPQLDLAAVRQRVNIPQLTRHDAEGIIALTMQGNGMLDDPSLNLQLRVGAIEDVNKNAQGKVTETRTTGGFGWDRYRDIAIAADGTLSRGVLRLRGLRLNWDAKDIFLGNIQLGSSKRRLPTVSTLLRGELPDDVDISFDLDLVNTPVAKLSAVSYMFASVKGTMGAALVGSGSLRAPEVRGRAHLTDAELGRSKATRRNVPADLCFDFKIKDNAVEASGFVQSWVGERPAILKMLPEPCERSMNYITQNHPDVLEQLKAAGVPDKEALLKRIGDDGTRDLFDVLIDARAYTDLIALIQGADPLDIPAAQRGAILPRREFLQRINAQIAGMRDGTIKLKEEERDVVIGLLTQRRRDSIMSPDQDLRIHAFTELGQQIELAELIPRWAIEGSAQDIAGRLLIDLDVQGSYKRLSPTGFVALEDGTITLPQFGRRFDKLTMRMAADEQKLTLAQLSLQENRASVAMSGVLRHRWMRPQGGEFKIAVKEFDFGSFAGMPLFVSGDVAAEGALDRQRLNANIDVTDLNVRLPKSDKSLHPTTQSSDVVVVRPAQPVPQNPELAGLGVPISQDKRALAALDATVRVKLAKNSWVRTEFGDVNFKGDITAQLDEGVVSMNGAVDTLKGDIEFLGKRFEVAPGNIGFNGGSPPNPSLQIEAIHKLDRALIADIGQPSSGEPRIIVRVTGTAKKPELQLMSDPAMTETDILYVLATGRPPGTAGVGQDESALGTALQAASGVFLGMLQQQLSGSVPVDVVRFNGAQSADSAGSIEVGKYITDRLFVSYAHVFSAGESEGANEFKLEYQFLPRWLIEVKYSDTNRGQLNLFWDAY